MFNNHIMTGYNKLKMYIIHDVFNYQELKVAA